MSSEKELTAEEIEMLHTRSARWARPWMAAAGSLALILAGGNIVFWLLVAAQFAPVKNSYLEGRTLWLGRHVMVFGHGYWVEEDGYWQHHTSTRLTDGNRFDGPTLALIQKLRSRGAQTIWGSWCYTGDYPYIRKDLITGRTTPWPSNTSYNRAPGLTIPIWVGATFVRLGWPRSDYDEAPGVIVYPPPDTLRLNRPSLQRFVSTFYRIRSPEAPLPNPDSLSWRDPAGESYSISWQEYLALPWHEKWASRGPRPDTTAAGERTGLLQFWIRGRAFPVPVRISE